VSQTEAIVLAVVGLFYLAALLAFVLALIRGDPRPVWRRLRVGVFVEREPRDDA